MRILGIIKEIHDLNLCISLPNNLTGYVSIAEISDELSDILEKIANEEEEEDEYESQESTQKKTYELPSLKDMFRIGEWVSCIVVSLESHHDHKKIELSLKPSLIHRYMEFHHLFVNMMIPSVVKSIEDHGYIMDFGIQNVKGFLLYNRTHENNGEMSEEKHLQKGQVLLCCILKIDHDNHIIHLSNNSEHIKNTIAKNDEFIQFDSITPGLLINTQIKKILSKGLWVSFFDSFEGFVDYFHFKEPLLNLKDLSFRYALNQKVRSNNKLKEIIIYLFFLPLD
jgi:rRNA biogenesis protein RRP5